MKYNGLKCKRYVGPSLVIAFVVLIVAANSILIIGQVSFATRVNPERWQSILLLIPVGVDLLCYFCIASLCWLEAKSLHEFFLDKASMVLLLLGAVLFCATTYFSNQIYFFLPALILLFPLSIVTIRNWSTVPKTIFRWRIQDVGSAFFVLLLCILIESLQAEVYSQDSLAASKPIVFIVRRIVQNLAMASVIEEIVIRGFLWGYLRKFGMGEKQSFGLQALVFWLLHFAQLLTRPITFFVTLPLLTLVYSVAAKDTRQTFWPIVLHTAFNATIAIVLTFHFS